MYLYVKSDENMTYRNLETIGKAIAYNMVDKDEKSLKLICEKSNISYNKIRILIHDDTKVSLFKLDELKEIQNVFNIKSDIIFDSIKKYFENK